MPPESDPGALDWLRQGHAAHQRGDLAAARLAYDRALHMQPGLPEALSLLASCAMQQRDWPAAVAALQQLLRDHPSQAPAHSMLGVALQFMGDLGTALAHFEEASRLEPRAAEHRYNLGKILRRAGRLIEAEEAYAEALRLRPDYAEAHSNLSEVLLCLGRASEALQAAQTALAQKPGLPEALINHGSALGALERHREAITAFDRALAAQPGAPRALLGRGLALAALGNQADARASIGQALAAGPGAINNAEALASGLRILKRHDEALRLIEEELARNPRNAGAHNLHGLILTELHQPRAALESFARAIALKPDVAGVFVNRGSAHLMLNDLAAARSAYDAALAIAPDSAHAHWNRCLCDLLAENYAEGWARYHWRWTVASPAAHPLPRGPRWDGHAKVEQLLVWEEQGIGDQILFASLLGELSPRAQHLLLAPGIKLLPLFRRAFPQATVLTPDEAAARHEDIPQIPFGDLGAILRPDAQSFPARPRPYLVADHARSRMLRSKLAGANQRLCGLSWRSINETVGREKSLALECLAPLFGRQDLGMINLQYGDVSPDIEALRTSTGFDLAREESVDLWNDVDGVAALVDACDIIVTTSNSTAHIAGALGKIVLLMVPYSLGRSWYWAEREGRSRWYPRLQVFRQQRDGDWTGVIHAVQKTLVSLAQAQT